MEKKTQLKNEVEDCAAKLDRAERLMGGLGGERIRWQQAVKQLASSYTNVTGDVMLSAGIIAYLGAFLAAISMLPFANFTDIAQSDYFWLALYGVTNLGIGFGCYFIGVKRTTAMATALLSMLDVILAPFFAWLLFAEVIATQTLIGGAVITGASLIYLRRQHQGVG